MLREEADPNRDLVDCNSEITSSRAVLGPRGPAFNSHAASAVIVKSLPDSFHALTGVAIASRLFEPKRDHHLRFFCYSPLVIDNSIPKDGRLFEFMVLSPGLARHKRDLIVYQHDGADWQ